MNEDRLPNTPRALFAQIAYRLALVSLLCVYAGEGILSAQSDNYLFQTQCFGVEDGLSNRGIYDFLLDQREVLWMATGTGLDSYDGTQIKNHKLNTALANLLYEDPAGYLWLIGYSAAVVDARPNTLAGRVSRFDPVTQRALSMEALGAPVALRKGVTRMCASPDRTPYFAATDGSIWRYTAGFEQVIAPNDQPIAWLGYTTDGLFYLRGAQLIHWVEATREKRVLQAVDPEQLLRIGKAGAAHYYLTKIRTPYTTGSGYRTTVGALSTGAVVYTFEEERPQPVFTLPDQTTGFYLPIKDTLQFHDWEQATVRTLPVNYLEPAKTREILSTVSYVDRYGRIYSSVTDGFCVSQLQASPFQAFLYGAAPTLSVRHIAPLDNQETYVTTSDGLYRFTADQATRLTTGEFPTSHAQDSSGRHWFGYHGPPLKSFNPTVEPIQFKVDHLADMGVKLTATLVALDTQTLYVGTNMGSYRVRTTDFSARPDTLLDEAGDRLTPAVTVNRYFGIQGDEPAWIATNQGVFERKSPTHWQRIAYLPRVAYTHIHRDAAGVYWMGTRSQGLLRYDAVTKELKQYGLADGLVDNCIYAVYEDAQGYLWLPSNKGLMCVDKQLKAIRVYLPEQGLPHEEFNWGAHAQDKLGRLYFGGLNGFIRFHPDTVRRWEQEREVQLKPAWKSVRRIRRKDGRAESVLPAVRTGSVIRYQPEEAYLQFSITQPNFTRKDIRYVYRVKAQTDWQPVPQSMPVELGYFPYGNQVLEIAEQSQLRNSLLSTQLYLPRPVHARWWFVPVLLALAMLFGYLFFYLRLQRLEKRRLALRDEVDRQTKDLRKLNQFKDRFFSILSHDLRSPLLGLRGLSKKARFLVERGRYDELTRLGTEVDKSTEAVQRLIGNVFEWAQLQQGEYEVRPVCIHARRLLDELQLIYQPLADERRVIMEFAIQDEVVPVADLDALRTILRNLVDNAIKNSPVLGSVRVLLGKGIAEEWYLCVQNDGEGMGTAARAALCSEMPSNIPTRTLGLRLIRELTILQGGRIRVSTEMGTQVRIDFPAE